MAADVQACLAIMVRFALFIVCKAKKHLYFYINICTGRRFCVSNATRPACQTLWLIFKDIGPLNIDNNLLYLIMTKTEIKIEIQKVLDNVPENVLQDILDLLKDLQNEPTERIEITHSLRQILSEDKELLEKLAK